MKHTLILSLLILTPALGLAEQKTWTIDTQEEWEQSLAAQSQLALKDGMASPTEKTATFQSAIKSFKEQRSAASITFAQSPVWLNWEATANVGTASMGDAPVLLSLGASNYWMLARYRPKKKAGFNAKPATLEGFGIPLLTTPVRNEFKAPGGLKPSMGGYHAWQSRDMVNWVHHGSVTGRLRGWVTTAEYVDGKAYIYSDFPNDQDPHLVIDHDLTDGLAGKDMGMAFKDPTHGSDSAIIRGLDGKFHLILEDWSPIDASTHAWDSPLAVHAVSDDGMKDFKILAPPVDERTKPTGKFAEYPHRNWHADDPDNYAGKPAPVDVPQHKIKAGDITAFGKYEIHEPEQNAYGDWAAIAIGGQHYLFCDFDPAGGHGKKAMSVGWFTASSIDGPFEWCGNIGQGHPDPDIMFAEGRFYIATQTAKDFVSPGPWVDTVEVRVGVDTDQDAKIDQWTDWQVVKERYDHTPGFAKQIQKTSAAMDLSKLPQGYGFQFEVRMTDTTANKSKPILDKVVLSFANAAPDSAPDSTPDSTPTSPAKVQGATPNIVVIMTDDMGYSDLGCYGGEIETPHLDGLAKDGVRFSQFYNTSRCSPTRSSLMTGLYSHQAGMGLLTTDEGTRNPGYRGRLMERCVTIAEVLRPQGYENIITGKWHMGDAKKEWWPLGRGFDRFYGCPQGGGFFFRPSSWKVDRFVVRDTEIIYDKQNDPPEGWYATDAFTDEGIKYVEDAAEAKKPFFWYLAYNAPHFPLQAKPEDIAKYRGKYLAGWDKLREARYQKLVKLGLVDEAWKLSARGKGIPAWDTLSEKEKDAQDERMAVYAAMIDCVDQNVGTIVTALKEMGVYENTLILFLHDNGGQSGPALMGSNNAKGAAGTAESEVYYGTCWANVSDTPFRKYKNFIHEGGIATPLIAHWPKGIAASMNGQIATEPTHLIDLMKTVVEISGATYPKTFAGHEIIPMEGESLLPLLQGKPFQREHPIFFEHKGNRGVRQEKWKLVALKGKPWELYDMETDRTELNNLATQMPEKVKAMGALYQDWATRCFVTKKKR